MRQKRYSSDLSARGWQVIKKIIRVQRKGKWDLMEVVNAIFYVSKNGCVWRDLPEDFPPWQTVYWYHAKWTSDGTWESINRVLVVENRLLNGKKFQPTVAIIDSQSAKNGPCCTDCVGTDGGKLVRGRKRFYVTCALGNLFDRFVVPANCHDGTTAAKRWARMFANNELLWKVGKVFADGTFGGTFREEMKNLYSMSVEVPKDPIAQKGNVRIHEKKMGRGEDDRLDTQQQKVLERL